MNMEVLLTFKWSQNKTSISNSKYYTWLISSIKVFKFRNIQNFSLTIDIVLLFLDLGSRVLPDEHAVNLNGSTDHCTSLFYYWPCNPVDSYWNKCSYFNIVSDDSHKLHDQ